MYGFSLWMIYHHIKTDPSFPVVNIGVKKRFLISPVELDIWLNNKRSRHNKESHLLPTTNELLEVNA